MSVCFRQVDDVVDDSDDNEEPEAESDTENDEDKDQCNLVIHRSLTDTQLL